jgi:hypothetical protein
VSSCGSDGCARNTLDAGGLAGVRGAYIFPSGLLLEWRAGYLSVSKGVSRHVTDAFTQHDGTSVPVAYDLEDAIRLSGPFYAAGVGYVRPLGPVFDLSAGTDLGVVVMQARDEVGGTASGGGRTLDVSIAGSGSPAFGAAPFVMPEARLTAKAGRFEASLGLALAVFPFAGPTLPTGELRLFGAACHDHPGAVDCLPGRAVIAQERAFGQLLFLWPTLSIGARF